MRPAIGLLLLVSTGCGGSSASTTSDSENGPVIEIVRDRFSAQPSLPEYPVELTPGEPLEVAFARARQVYHRENVETFDTPLAYATSAASDFAWYFTVNDSNDGFSRTQHVYFVVTEAWNESTTRAFLMSYLVMPGSPLGETGRPWFHIYSAQPPPLAVQFMFSNTPGGALESAILSGLGASAWRPADVPELAAEIEVMIQSFGLAAREELSETCPSVLDELYAALPRPDSDDTDDVFGRRYVPEGTLAAIGLLVGESIRRALAGAAEWEEDDSSEVYPRLRVTDVADGALRPIPFMIEFFIANAEVMPTDYCNRMVERLTGP
jgi:hypothetical protein